MQHYPDSDFPADTEVCRAIKCVNEPFWSNHGAISRKNDQNYPNDTPNYKLLRMQRGID